MVSYTLLKLLKKQELKEVLILVVVDNGLVPSAILLKEQLHSCLNPCCSGQWSRTVAAESESKCVKRLNPCCSGQWSRTL